MTDQPTVDFTRGRIDPSEYDSAELDTIGEGAEQALAEGRLPGRPTYGYLREPEPGTVEASKLKLRRAAEALRQESYDREWRD